MISPSQFKKAKQAVFDAAEEQMDLLHDTGLGSGQEQEFYQELADYFAAEADNLDDLGAGNDIDEEEDEGEDDEARGNLD